MPLYDRRCDTCGFRRNDCYEQSTCVDYSCSSSLRFKGVGCPGTMNRIPMTQNPGAKGRAQGDECDVLAKHGLCNPDGTPHRYTSKSEMRKVAAERGLTNYVRHKPGPSSDRCKETQRWV